MSFKRNIISVINFNTNTFYDSDIYDDFIVKNPTLKFDLNSLIIKFVRWAECPNHQKDYCFDGNTKYSFSDSWSVDENNGSRENFINQMGTTKHKFSLTENSELRNKRLQVIASVFSKIGFPVFVVNFTSWHVGYNYEFTLLEEFNGDVEESDSKENEFTHICVCI